MKTENYLGLFLTLTITILIMAGQPLFVQSPARASTQGINAVPGELRSYATIHSIGIEWDVTGDDNHNTAVSVQYRKQGPGSWSSALPLFRVDFNGFDMLAGSIFFLEPGTTYEVQLALSDPDGGNETQTISITTRSVPELPTNGRQLHVIPGSGGGDGSAANPYQGIDAAQTAAQPGDIFLLHSGSYPGEIHFDTPGTAVDPIVWKAAGDGEVVFDNVRIAADYIWLEGLKITAADYGLRTYNAPIGIVISRNTFVNCHYCIYLNHGGENWYIADNVIVGDEDPGSGSLSGEGVELNHTSGHVVAHNSISRVADGISYPDYNVDIYGNDIFDVSDDGIEPDYGYANVRIWGNRVSNALHNGISFQPMNSAPWYLIRNQVAAPAENALKLRDNVDRALLAHNTLVGWNGAQTVQTHHLLAMQSNNNLWITVEDFYAWENGSGGSPDWRTNLDYDGFDWGNYVYAFKWSDRYPDLASFQAATGLELHGIQVDKNTCFATFNVPNPPPAPVPPQYMTLKADCNAVDAGIVLPNINDDFGGSGPDLGAYEVGAPLPIYGPREPVALELVGTPADQAIHLSWEVTGSLPETSSWQIIYDGPTGDEPSPITGIDHNNRSYALTGLTNFTSYTITLNALVDNTPILTGTVSVMPTDISTYLPLLIRGSSQ